MSTLPEADPAIANFLAWLRQAGAQLSAFEIVSLGGGERCVRATRDMSAQEPLMRIPRQCVLGVPDAQASEIGRLLEAHGQIEDERMYLSAFLLQERERGEGSFWKPYLDILPKAFPTHPFYFEEREFALLKGSFLHGLVEFQRKSLADRYAHLCQHVPGFQRFSFEDFTWSYFAVVSRTFTMTHQGAQVACLVPLQDMINESKTWDSLWNWSDEGQCFDVTVVRTVARGQEFFTTYGDKSNMRLLFQYGFVHEDNAHNEVMLVLSLRPEDPLIAEKQRLLGLADPSEPRAFSLGLELFSPAMSELFAFLRIVHANAEDRRKLADSPDPLVRAKGQLSPGNEQKLIPAFVSACEELLAGYANSVEEDDRLLREEKLSHNARSCVVLRRGEKRILQTCARSYADLARSGFLPSMRL